MFAGYQQQDSQEFLTFLLDGLHEGLNEVSLFLDHITVTLFIVLFVSNIHTFSSLYVLYCSEGY